MSPKSAAFAAAWRLWARAAGNARSAKEVVVAAERICSQLRIGLTRWVGAQGYRAVLDRALKLTRPEHRALDGISCLGGDEPELTKAIAVHGAETVAASLVELMAAVIEVLGRAIGEEMAVRLVEQTGAANPRDAVSSGSPGGRDA